MDHAIFRSVEDCQDIHLDGAGPRVEEPTPGLSVRGAALWWRHALRVGVRLPRSQTIFRTITPDGTSPTQYLPPHRRVVGCTIGLRSYRSGGFVWTRRAWRRGRCMEREHAMRTH